MKRHREKMPRTIVVICIAALACTFALGQVMAYPVHPETPAAPEEPGALKIELVPTEDAPEGAEGFVVINEDATGHYQVAIQVHGLEPSQWVAWGVGTGWRVSEFQCNRRGDGHDEIILEEIEDKVNVKAIDKPGGAGPVIFTADIPG